MFHTIKSIKPICDELRQKGKKIVLATGFFDLLHAEHINFLKKAKISGDILIVAVESDERARITKGEGRPIDTQSIRCQKVLDYADYVIALSPDFDHFEAYDDLMSAIRPQVYAVSSHTSHQKTKNFLVEKYGGRLVVVHEFNPEISTTQIINNKNIN
ncbi:adenylyltransferase/cytidyltransferase family protein [Candidatus Woesebacteria bacterium]|nr:adenylyltransferase/cytidyltransferase family protein [Candidatus Woesebacteria bacterium]